MGIEEAFSGKVLFITGCTGFLGKVLVEKLAYSLPTIKRIYILIRVKKSKNKVSPDPQERLRQEIIASPMMKRIKVKYGEKYLEEKLVAVSGDLTTTIETTPEILRDIQIIVHGAATLSFNEDLDIAIQANVYGTQKIFDLAKKCPNLQSFVHISTTYSNFPHMDFVEERVYPMELNEPIIDFCARICKMSKEEVAKIQPQLLTKYNFPNTYSFTKRLTELLIQSIRPKDMTLILFRPSIVCSSWKEPMPGWVDNVSAIGTVYVSNGMGVSSLCLGHHTVIGDVIPVDFVINSIILSIYKYNLSKTLTVVQCGSSALNPIQWGAAVYNMLWYWNTNPPKQQFFKPRFRFATTKLEFDTLFFLKYSLPVSIMSLVSTQKKTNLLNILRNKALQVANAFGPFTSNDCIFDTSKLENIRKELSKEENDEFFTDPALIDWHPLFQEMLNGIAKYVLKEEFERPLDRNLITTIFMADGCLIGSEPATLADDILNSPRILTVIESLIKINESNDTSNSTYWKYLKRTREIIQASFFNQKNKSSKLVSTFLKKYLSYHYTEIKINENDARRIQTTSLSDRAGPIVYFPTRYENVDFWLIPFVCVMYGTVIPHTLLSNVYLMRSLLGMLGAFFAPDSGDPLEEAIYYEYIERMILNGSSLQFPMVATNDHSAVLELLIDLVRKQKIVNVTIVPVQIHHLDTQKIRLEAPKLISLKDLLVKDDLNTLSLLKQEMSSVYKSPDMLLRSKL
jgi:nucleoside-diphosphate-sugar epimerase